MSDTTLHTDCTCCEHAAKEIDRLQALVEGDFKKSAELSIQSMLYPDEHGGMKLDLQATIIPLIAEHLAQIFKLEGGENYLGIEFNHPELGPMTLSIQRRFGETPAAQNARLKEELKEAREVMKPFADLSIKMRRLDDRAVIHEYGDTSICVGDLRRARAFLDRGE